MDIKNQLYKFHIRPDPIKDQFFLTNQGIVKKMVQKANLNKDDFVLEIGAGIGNLTAEIAKKAGKVIVFEIDKRFKPILSDLPKNVEFHFESAWDYIQLKGKFKKKREFNKIVANPPFSLIEPLLHNLTFLEYDKVVLLVPLVFVKTIKTNGIFSSFFDPIIKFKVEKNDFYPQPKTNSVVIDLIKLPDPLKEKNLSLYLRQYIYQHENQKLKNSLREGLVQFTLFAYKKKLAKSKAEEMIRESNIENELLNKTPQQDLVIYKRLAIIDGFEIIGKLKNLKIH